MGIFAPQFQITGYICTLLDSKLGGDGYMGVFSTFTGFQNVRVSTSFTLSIYVLAVPKINLCMKYAILCVESHPVLRFKIRAIFVASRTKACKKSRFLMFPYSGGLPVGKNLNLNGLINPKNLTK